MKNKLKKKIYSKIKVNFFYIYNFITSLNDKNSNIYLINNKQPLIAIIYHIYYISINFFNEIFVKIIAFNITNMRNYQLILIIKIPKYICFSF